MRIPPHYAIGIAPHQQRQLAMRLQSEDAVKDSDSRVLELSRPANIRIFIESRHQLDDDGDFLALPRLSQGREDRRILARPVKRLLHRDHAGILRSRLDKLLHRLVGIERMMQHHIALPQLVEDIGRLRDSA